MLAHASVSQCQGASPAGATKLIPAIQTYCNLVTHCLPVPQCHSVRVQIRLEEPNCSCSDPATRTYYNLGTSSVKKSGCKSGQ
ncbi:hypothetical protein PoB_005193800 [Plakobranchus ocellatus]|uniref:Uncharacterized protein n=1 Tax=Plakobranchus ocellatus TaxID=259542 RepID=A0AAV4C0L4_9GAST|nr:hypothetical protein PoB_005193800 [Plakobranchus ocellatus]